MANKTEFNHYNEDDFVQCESGDLRELTVTITLCEYRNLVRENAEQDKIIDRLHEEKAELEKKYSDATVALAAVKLPEWTKIISGIFGGEEPEEELDEDGGDCGNGEAR